MAAAAAGVSVPNPALRVGLGGSNLKKAKRPSLMKVFLSVQTLGR